MQPEATRSFLFPEGKPSYRADTRTKKGDSMEDRRHLAKLEAGVNAWNQWRKERPEIEPDLRKADLHGKVLNQIDFRRTNLDDADLSNAQLSFALLNAASLYRTNLSGARLRHANLHKTYFKETVLQNANFHKALLLDTAFLNVDLSNALNLETLFHLGPSTIGIDTLERFRGKIPEVFLRHAGVSQQLLNCIHSSGSAPFDYQTCFLSYCSRDQRFVDTLYRDLRNAGVLCWFAPESLKAGDKFQECITNAVQSQEKVLAVLSKHALTSKWVRKEVELARRREGNGKRNILVPIYLDSTALHSTVDWVEYLRKHRHMRSFENWQQPAHHRKPFDGLLNDLRR